MPRVPTIAILSRVIGSRCSYPVKTVAGVATGIWFSSEAGSREQEALPTDLSLQAPDLRLPSAERDIKDEAIA